MSVRESSPPPVDAAPIFAALGDQTRLALIGRLLNGEQRSITELSRGLALTRQGVTKHLHILEAAGVVAGQRVGRESRYELRREPIDRVREFLNLVSREWDVAIDRLKSHLEE